MGQHIDDRREAFALDKVAADEHYAALRAEAERELGAGAAARKLELREQERAFELVLRSWHEVF